MLLMWTEPQRRCGHGKGKSKNSIWKYNKTEDRSRNNRKNEAGNNYKTRIYPIPSNGYKRVVIAYTEVLKNKNGSSDYFLPLNYSQKVNNFSLEIKMLKQESRPNWIEKCRQTGIDKMESGYYAKTSLKNYTPDKNVRISLPLW